MLAKLTSPKVLLFALFLYTAIPSFAQKKVEGKVTGPDGKPVFGATVTAKGTTVSTVTSTDGSYSITLPASSSILEISYVVNQTKQLNLRNKTTL